jgi:subtilase family serine protease
MTRLLSKGFAFIPIIFCLSSTFALAQQNTPEVHPPINVQGNAKPGIVGLVPSQVRQIYGFDKVANQGEGQLIGIVDAHKHPQIEKDLGVFSQTFGLPACTTSNGCFQQVIAGKGDPGTDTLWALEIALDVEWAHAIAPKANILLVNTQSAKLTDMVQGVDLAVQMGATVVSMSWGGPEFATEAGFDNHFLAANVTFVAASGDFGNPGFYPAASPNVTGVGGTTLGVDAGGNLVETAWSGSGGGISILETEPAYQANFHPTIASNGMRGIPDVAYNAGIGYAVYDSTPYHGLGGWFPVGGSSAATPQWASLIAVANSARLQNNKSLLGGGANIALYNAAADFNDVTSGTNGSCGAVCTAGPGYDFVTGLGSPKVASLINALKNQ